MDSPLLLAFIVFAGIFLLFFFISLLSDLVIVGVALSTAIAAYFIPEWYPVLFEMLKDTQIPTYLGLAQPDKLDDASRYLVAVMLTVLATLVCIPVLPFSATYRQMLGANKIGRQDEAYIKTLIHMEDKGKS
ncbi:hypothetical protein QUF61_16415 [Candidatus Venteria ishoeyi]|uniref:hypothetical protein n=1 Tax=Candidatus Venteria ishoeyi TaxID=1899563 RepID=UPI0025A63088|nr:hypothetical protein [Candidatus Venteria ishoeyi]MDM8548073.1 hypothetical protein [Candidatus Venteria ishoeyi]